MTAGDTAPQTAIDLQDERLRMADGLRGAFTTIIDRFRGGDLGVFPVVAGLVVIWTVLQSLNPIFLSSANLVNLTMECAAVGIIALGSASSRSASSSCSWSVRSTCPSAR